MIQVRHPSQRLSYEELWVMRNLLVFILSPTGEYIGEEEG